MKTYEIGDILDSYLITQVGIGKYVNPLVYKCKIFKNYKTENVLDILVRVIGSLKMENFIVALKFEICQFRS